MNRVASHLLALVAALLFTAPAIAQATPEEHASHHPDQAAAPETTDDQSAEPDEGEDGQPTETSGGGMGGSGGMGSMMEQMGVPKPKDLYPTLMNLPDLSPDALAEIENRAQKRVQSGIAMMTEALDQMSQASPENDFVTMQQAAVLFREGFARFESGLATRQFLSEGQQPQEIAINWFRREMNIAPRPPGDAMGPLGLSWFHFITMIVLVLFGTAMICMHYAKMRRASALIMRLTKTDGER